MVERIANDARQNSNVTGNLVLVASKDGAIRSMLEAPECLQADKRALSEATLDDLWPKALADTVRKNIQRTIRGRKFHSDEVENPADGRSYEFIYVPQGRNRVLLVVRDISDSKVALSRIRQLAYMDEVTELPNREFLFTELHKIAEMQRLKEGRSAVICLHVEQFDNDGHALIAGHGDALLRELASRLELQLRGMNDATRTDFDRYSVVARTDYRQFAVVLPNIESGEDAESVVMRLLGSLQQPVSIGSRDVAAAVFAGIALFPQDGTDAAGLFKNAVAAMEDSRNSPTGSFKFHSGTVRLRNLQRQDLTADLRSALDRDDFTLKFLPTIDTATGAVRSVESLLRWPTEILGARSTRKVVTIAEYTGLIVDIGRWVLHRACRQLSALREANHDAMRLTVNLSAQEFSRADLAGHLAETLDEYGIDPAWLELEINEHMVFRDALQQHAQCRALKGVGVGIVIDDFGTGSCALSHLSQSPVDAIKIDNSFVANIESSDRDRAACAAAITFGHGLGMDVIAEGVETDAQADFLRDHGCDAMQGFLFSTPLAGDELIAYLDACSRSGTNRAFAS